MKGWRLTMLLVCVVGISLAANAQLARITIPAGTPEDQAIQAITNEGDAQKRTAMWEEFVGKYKENPQAVAYGNWQLSQVYNASGDNRKALDYVDKALSAMPNNLDILVAAASVAQQMKDTAKVMDYAARGGKAYAAVGSMAKPEGMSAEDLASKIAEEKRTAQPNYEFLESSAYNVIAAEEDAKARLNRIEQYADAFPESRFSEQVNAYAIMSVQQMNDSKKLAEFADKVLAKNPNSVSTLVLLATAFAEDQNPASAARAVTYAKKAIELAKPEEAGAEKSRKLQAGMAHSALGYALMKENKTAPAIVELKTAAELVKENPTAYSTVMFRLGYAHTNAKQFADAKAAFGEAAQVEGPFQEQAKKNLEQINSAKPVPAKRTARKH
jgi:tetratricopeptide (TPR) repeat protein